MSSPIISVKNIGKKYKLGATLGGRNYKTLRDVLTQVAFGPFRKLSAAFRKEHSASGSHSSPNNTITQSPNNSITKSPNTSKEFWALKDISFDVQQGEVVGIIGANGAGKSTLLKILSEITEPTEGEIRIRGRVASLLEVGTGFHPELSGRENVYMNGAILGMTKAEIDAKFDEIVAFAGVEKFIDTPVKRYSSGMQVRLAFAVAAHLEPEILVVDEVLAVGDMEFQKKCIGQMDRVAKEGRTVLFVSHNMTAVANLCTRALCLSDGKIVDAGLPEIVISNYYNLGAETGGEVIWENMQTAPGNDKIRLHAVRIVVDGKATTNVDIQKDVEIQIEFWNLDQNAMVSSSIHLLDKMGTKVLASGNMPSACLNDDGWFGRPHPVGIYRTFCILPGNFLNEGLYRINVIVLTNTNQIQARIDEVVSFTVYDTGDMRKEYHGTWIGVVRPKLRWQTKLLDI